MYKALKKLAQTIHADAVDHGLWDSEDRYDCILLILDELREMLEAVHEPEDFAEELADVIIISLSSAVHLGINISAEIQNKVAYNRGRPHKHGKEEPSCKA